MTQQIEMFYDKRTYTLTYVIYDDESRDAVIIDPVLDYDPKGSKTWTESVDVVIDFVKSHGLEPVYILETHAHADHLSGSQILKETFPDAKLAIGSRITEVQKMFKNIFNLPKDFPTDGSQFDQLLEPGKSYQAGSLEFDVIPTPGHTPACVSFKFDDAVFTGDALFMPDMGTGRCDFPGGSAEDLYDSVMRLYELPGDTMLYVGHDYQPGGRELRYAAPVSEHREKNVALPASRDRADFVNWRKTRDAGLEAPQLLFQSVQVNVDAGALPKPADNEIAYLRIPINVFRPQKDDGEMTIEDL
jgi:glyoxylase-like metal-dependent hydrolase (beta-lactamase superfamily II)